MGIGVGLSCSLSILFFALKTKTATETAQISGMAQSFGYLFAAFGPVCFGYLHQFTQSWFTVIALLVLLTIGQWGSGWFIEKQTYIFEK
jgi:CP family cyanate transporter-like MFS transporter